MVPHVLAANPLKAKGAERTVGSSQLSKNVALLGGVLLAAQDTEGKPNLAWRVRTQKQLLAQGGSQAEGRAASATPARTAEDAATRRPQVGPQGSPDRRGCAFLIHWPAPVATVPSTDSSSFPAPSRPPPAACCWPPSPTASSTLTGVLDSRDTALMRAGLTVLGAAFTDLPDGRLARPPGGGRPRRRHDRLRPRRHRDAVPAARSPPSRRRPPRFIGDAAARRPPDRRPAGGARRPRRDGQRAAPAAVHAWPATPAVRGGRVDRRRERLQPVRLRAAAGRRALPRRPRGHPHRRARCRRCPTSR